MTHPGGGGKDLQTGGLDLIAKGLTAALGELKECGVDSWAGAGRGFAGVELSGLELGHEGLTEAFKSFCDRWEWGVRSLIGEGNAFAQGVGLSAGTFYETDQYVAGTAKVVVNAAIGNPAATEDEVTGMGWGELLRHNEYAHPDFSPHSFQEANKNIEQSWKGAGRDVLTSYTSGPVPGLSPELLRKSAGISDEAYNAWLDKTFGPPPGGEARAVGRDGGE